METLFPELGIFILFNFKPKILLQNFTHSLVTSEWRPPKQQNSYFLEADR